MWDDKRKNMKVFLLGDSSDCYKVEFMGIMACSRLRCRRGAICTHPVETGHAGSLPFLGTRGESEL